MEAKNIIITSGIIGISVYIGGQVDTIIRYFKQPVIGANIPVIAREDKGNIVFNSFNDIAMPQPQFRLIVGGYPGSVMAQLSMNIMPAIIDTDSLLG